MSRMRGTALACCAAFVAYLIASCSGGGGSGGTPPQFVVSPANLSFSAASPNDATPPSQPITATVNGVSANTLFVRVVVTGPAVASVDNLVITGPNSGRLSVHVASPSTIGPGSHASVITVTACTTDINCSGALLTGSPATINVAYQVGAVPPPPDAVAPSVGTANVSDEVIIRGRGFVPGTLVSFGSTPASTSTVVSATEIHATYPPLPAGIYQVALNGGATAFSGSVTLVQPNTLTGATTLNYPSVVQNMRGLVYDARRQALLVGTGDSNPGANKVLRYTFNGAAWNPASLNQPLPDVRGLALSLDGERLLAITDTAVVELDPVTLAPRTTTTRTTNPAGGIPLFLKSIVATNDGKASIVSGGQNFNQRWLYDVAARSISIPFSSQFQPVIGGPDNGSRVVLVEGGLSSPQPVLQYSASSGLVSTTSFNLQQNSPAAGNLEDINPPVFDRRGTRMLVFGATNTSGFAHTVYDPNFTALGKVPSGFPGTTTAAYALSPDGARAYILELGTGVCRVHAFDLGAPPVAGGLFPEIVVGFPIDIAPCPADFDSKPTRMLLNPPGDTLFIAGTLSIRIERLP